MNIYSTLSFNKSFLDRLPVHNVKDCIHIIWSHIPVINIVSVFPHINSKKRNKASSCLERILIGTSGSFDRSSVCVITQPSPSTSLNSNSQGREVFLHGIKVTKSGIYSILQSSAGWEFTTSLCA